jgi:hypothetical protein
MKLPSSESSLRPSVQGFFRRGDSSAAPLSQPLGLMVGDCPLPFRCHIPSPSPSPPFLRPLPRMDSSLCRHPCYFASSTSSVPPFICPPGNPHSLAEVPVSNRSAASSTMHPSLLATNCCTLGLPKYRAFHQVSHQWYPLGKPNLIKRGSIHLK